MFESSNPPLLDGLPDRPGEYYVRNPRCPICGKPVTSLEPAQLEFEFEGGATLVDECWVHQACLLGRKL